MIKLLSLILLTAALVLGIWAVVLVLSPEKTKPLGASLSAETIVSINQKPHFKIAAT